MQVRMLFQLHSQIPYRVQASVHNVQQVPFRLQVVHQVLNAQLAASESIQQPDHLLARTAQQVHGELLVDYKMLLALEHALLVNTLLLDHHLALIVLLA
jgi:hypothetical protein